MIGESRKKSKQRKNEIADILRRVDRLPTLDPRSPEEIVGYDEHGIPKAENSKRRVEATVPNRTSVAKPRFPGSG